MKDTRFSREAELMLRTIPFVATRRRDIDLFSFFAVLAPPTGRSLPCIRATAR